MDARNETLNKRIREGSLKKIPYIVIIGEKEAEQKTVSVRKHGTGDAGVLPEIEFLAKLTDEREKKI
jgi:threonyl-tRNA synthetase